MLDDYDISWATQYELARGVSNNHWTWADVTPDKIHALASKGNDSPQGVERVMGKRLCSQKHEIWCVRPCLAAWTRR